MPFWSTHNMCDWYLPTGGTTDIFSSEIPNKDCWSSMPTDVQDLEYIALRVGTQLPRTGSRFIGLFTYRSYHSNAADTLYREYAEVALTEPLVIGENYCAEMYVSLADWQQYASNNLGLYFHESEIEVIDSAQLFVTPQVYEEKVIEDDTYWTKISGTFNADSAYRYLTIGNFFENYQTTVVHRGNPPDGFTYYQYSYYFIDDVSVTTFQPKEFIYSGNTTICEGESASIGISGGLENITCSTLSDTTKLLGQNNFLSVSPTSTTSYLIKGINCGTVVKDTLTVTVKPGRAVDLIPDKSICSGTSLTLDARDGYKIYEWQDGSQDRYFNVTEAGSYNVWVENEHGCRYYDNVNIKVDAKPRVDLGRDTVVCSEYYPLNLPSDPNTSFSWSTGSTSNTITPTVSGVYSVTVENHCGQTTDTIEIKLFDNIFIPNVVTLNDDGLNEKFVIQGGTSILELSIYNRGGLQIFQTNNYQNTWPPDDKNISAGNYYYSLTYPGCEFRKGWIQVIVD